MKTAKERKGQDRKSNKVSSDSSDGSENKQCDNNNQCAVLNEAQRNCPVTKKKLLASTETLKHNNNIFHGGKIIV